MFKLNRKHLKQTLTASDFQAEWVWPEEVGVADDLNQSSEIFGLIITDSLGFYVF